jgi:hypothetical protein
MPIPQFGWLELVRHLIDFDCRDCFSEGRLLEQRNVLDGSWAEMLMASILRPFYPSSRPMRGHPEMAALCHEQTCRVAKGFINSRGAKAAASNSVKANVHRIIGRSCVPISLVNLERASDDRWFPGAALARANLVASNEGSP